MPFRPLAVALGALTCCAAALANEVQFHICAAAQNLGQAYARTKYFSGQFGPDQTADVAASLANAAAEIAAAEAGVQQPFFTQPDRQRSIAELQAQLAAYARNAQGRSPSARMVMIQGFYTHYRNALSYSYASNRSDAFRWNPTCDSRMLDANWHLGLAATYAAVRFDRGTVDEIHARSDQSGANGSAFQAIQAGLRLALDGTGPTPLEYCFFNTEQAWSIVPMLPHDEPWATYVDLLPRVLEVCRSAGPNHLPGRHVTVPHCAGLMLADAKRRLAEAGLAVQLGPGSPAPAAADTGKVEAQSVAAGTRVAAGTPVRLTVHSPYVPPRVVVATPAVDTGEQPPVACPQSLMRQVMPGVINACPNMEWVLAPGFGGIRSNLRASGLYCSYHVPNAPQSGGGRLCEHPARFVDVWWIGAGATDVDTRGNTDFCQQDFFVNGVAADDERLRRGEDPMMTPNHWKLYSRTHKVRVEFYTEAWDEQYGLSVARQMIAQIEPYAQTCSGAPPTSPTPAPVFQLPTPVPTPVPPPGPPACPGPAVTVIYDLWNPPPYGGLGGVICRDGAGGMWVNIANNVYQVNSIRTGRADPSTGCFADTGVVTPHHTYGGTLCPK